MSFWDGYRTSFSPHFQYLTSPGQVMPVPSPALHSANPKKNLQIGLVQTLPRNIDIPKNSRLDILEMKWILLK
jgi:hypothetical protein